MSSTNSPTYTLAKELTKILSPLADKSCHTVRNSIHFVQLLRDIRIEPNDRMVSFDVVNLFTKVPINEAISIVSYLLHKDTTLVERTNLPPDIITDLLKKCLTTTFFKFGDNFYQQTEGAAMGSPPVPSSC